MQTDTLKNNTDTSLPFKVTSRIYGGGVSNDKNLQLRIQLDDRLTPYVKDIKVSEQGGINQSPTQITLTRVGDTNTWSSPLFKLYGGPMGIANVDIPWSNPNCVIDFNDQIQNFWQNLGDLSANPLQYAIYGYDERTQKTIGNYQSVGYIISQGSPYDLPIATGSDANKPATNQPYYQGAQMTLLYDHANNTINAFYNPQMLGVWSWDGIAQSRINKLNYQVDPRLVPYIESVTMHNLQSGPQAKLYNDNGTPYTGNTVVNSTDLSIGQENTPNVGKGAVEVTKTNMDISGLPRQNHLVEISYKLHTPLADIINQLGLKSDADNRLQFGAYFTAANGDMAPYTLATNAYDIVAQETQAEQNTPEGGRIDVDEGATLTPADAERAISNSADLNNLTNPSDPSAKTSYSWANADQINTATPGNKAGLVNVTYPDGSVDANVPVIVHVKSQAEANNPEGQDINVNKGETPNPQEGIKNRDQMPAGTTYTWPDGKTPDTSKAGNVPADVVVTYPDGSQDVVPTTVVIKDSSATPSTEQTDADKYAPQGQIVDTTLGNVPAAEKAIKNAGDLPAGTTYEWSQTPNTYSKGEHPGVVKVTYPDGSVDYVPATVNVTNEPTGKTVSTTNGTVPAADTTIDWGNGTEPTGTTVEWQTEPDVSTPGTHPGTVKITYPDGENTTVPVNVVVPDTSSATNFNPYGGTINVPYGHTMTNEDAKNAIAGGVPADAQNVSYSWATTPDTTKPGLTQAYVNVTATIDGRTQTKTVPVYVKVGTQADLYNPEGQNLTVNKGAAVPDAKTAISNTSSLPDGSKYTWAIAPDTNTVGTQSGLVKVTYPDGSVDYVPVNVTVKDNRPDNEKYQPEYGAVEVEPGKTATATPTWATTNGNDGQPTDGATFANTADTQDWASVAVDGTVTLKPGADQKSGDYLVPVKVTYYDGTSEVVNVPVAVKGGSRHDNTVTYYGQNNTTSMAVAEYTTHKTSDGTVTDIPAPAITKIVFSNQDAKWKVLSSVTYQLQGDRYVATTPITNPDGSPIQLLNGTDAPASFAASDITTQWEPGFAPNTNVDNYLTNGTKDGKGSGTGSSLASTQYAQAPNGDQRTSAGQSLPGNSKTRITITLHGEAATMFASASWSNAFGNIYGATTNEALTFKQGQDISNLTQEQYRHLIDVTDLGANGWNGQNINPNAPQVLAYMEGSNANRRFAMTWAPNGQPSTAEVANGVKGTVRISFSDGTYLDVPATINVVADPDSGKPDQDKTVFTQKIVYTYQGHEVAYTTIDVNKGADLSADALKTAIDGNVPDNYQIADGFSYPAGLSNVTATPAEIKVPLALKSGEAFNVIGQMIYQLTDGTKVANGPEIKSNKGDTLTAGLLKDLANKNLPDGYEIVTYPASYYVNSDNFTIPVTVKKSIKYDPTNQQMNKEVTRTIKVYKTDGTTETVYQAVHFVRGGEGQVAETIDPDGQIHWTPWTVATKDGNTWRSNGATATMGTWAKYDVAQVTGYTSTVDGTAATKVDADSNITADTADVTVNVAYTKTTSPDDHNIDPITPGENSDMFAHPTRTINVTDPITGAVNTTKQTVWFGRTKTTSTDPAVATTYGDWQLGTVTNHHFTVDPTANSMWPEFITPTVADYTPSQMVVTAKNVTATTADEIVNITYTKADNSDHDNGVDTTPTSGDKGNHNNANDANNSKDGKVTVSHNGGDDGSHNNTNTKSLPQTGNDTNVSTFAGLGVASLMAMLGLSGYKKRENK